MKKWYIKDINVRGLEERRKKWKESIKRERKRKERRRIVRVRYRWRIDFGRKSNLRNRMKFRVSIFYFRIIKNKFNKIKFNRLKI